MMAKYLDMRKMNKFEGLSFTSKFTNPNIYASFSNKFFKSSLIDKRESFAVQSSFVNKSLITPVQTHSKRVVFSNESGVGNAPMYHGQSQSKLGTNEGLVAMLGPLLDTILVCTITGLIVIISGAYLDESLNGIVLTLEAFRLLFFGFGDELLMIIVFIFGISTLLTYSYYGVKCYGFLTKPEKGKYYNIIYIIAIIFSALATVEIVIGIIDIAFALMAIPNMIAILYLGKHITKEMKERAWI